MDVPASSPLKTCPHLQPIERAALAAGAVVGDGMPSPYGPKWGTWYPVNCTFDGPALRQRLGIESFVTFEEYDGQVAGSDATFHCPLCNMALMGVHPHYAGAGTPKVS